MRHCLLALSVPIVLTVSGCNSADPSFVQSEVRSKKSEDLKIKVPGEPVVHIEGKPDVPKTILEGEGEIFTTNQEFKGFATEEGAFDFSLSERLGEHWFDLSRSYTDASESFTQVDRTAHVDSYKQGNPASSGVDSFIQTDGGNSGAGVLDILVVVDNSGSMDVEQANLSDKLNPLLSYVSNSDWRIGVVTTDPGDSCLRELVKKNDADVEGKFAAAIQAGTQGSGNEQGIRQAVAGLKAECTSSPWVRSASTVAVLFVSDEDNCSDGQGCGNNSWASESHLTDYLSQIRTPGTDARIYGLFWDPSQDSSACSTAYNQANQYSAAVQATGGTWGSICDADYSDTLAAISNDIASILEHQFTLTHTPESGTIRVFVDSVELVSGWNISGNVLNFDTPPVLGSQIQVTYDYGPVPMFDKVTLSHNAASETIAISFNGNPINPSMYSFDTTKKEVSFHTLPPASTDIVVNYRANQSLVSDFNIGANRSSVVATVNGIAVKELTYNDGTGNVHFVEAPLDAAQIVIEYKIPGDPILSYPYALSEGQSTWEVYDRETSAVLSPAFMDSQLVFVLADFWEGRKIGVRDPDWEPSEDPYLIEIPVQPVEDSVELVAEGEICENLIVDGRVIDLNLCGLVSLNEATIKYDFVVSEERTFTLDPALFNKPHTSQLWTVEVNGYLVTEYAVEGNVITFDDGVLSPDATISVQVSLFQDP